MKISESVEQAIRAVMVRSLPAADIDRIVEGWGRYFEATHLSNPALQQDEFLSILRTRALAGSSSVEAPRRVTEHL